MGIRPFPRVRNRAQQNIIINIISSNISYHPTISRPTLPGGVGPHTPLIPIIAFLSNSPRVESSNCTHWQISHPIWTAHEGFLPPLLHGGLSIFSGHTIDQLGHAQLPRFPCLLFVGRGDDFRRTCLQLLRGVINGTDFVTHGVTFETMFYNQSDVVLKRVPVYCERVFAQSALTSRAASFSPSMGSTFSSWEFDACHCLKPHLRDPHHPHCPTLTHSLSANSAGAL